MSIRRNLSRFRAESGPRRARFLEALFWLGLARLAVALLPFRWTLRGLALVPGETAEGHDPEAVAPSQEVAWAVSTAANHTPWRSACLEQALAGLRLLRRQGLTGTLYLGVAKPGGRGPDLAAHAWLRCGDRLITGASGHERFTRISAFRPQP